MGMAETSDEFKRGAVAQATERNEPVGSFKRKDYVKTTREDLLPA